MRSITFGFLFLFALFLFLKPSIFLLHEEASKSAGVSYALAYPGILPDNPLYFLKALRDSIVGFFISDPLKKAEFDLLQADKRLGASLSLLKKNSQKQKLAVSTLSKAENYFFDALAKTREAKTRGENTEEFSRKLFLASQKHEEEIKHLAEDVAPSFKQQVLDEAKRVSVFQKEAQKMQPK